jgi:hypothetical protein
LKAAPDQVEFGLNTADGHGVSADVLSHVLARMTGGFGGGNISDKAASAAPAADPVAVADPVVATSAADDPVVSDETAAMEASLASEMLSSVGGDGGEWHDLSGMIVVSPSFVVLMFSCARDYRLLSSL